MAADASTRSCGVRRLQSRPFRMCASTPTWLWLKMASACCPYIEQYADCSATEGRREGVGFDGAQSVSKQSSRQQEGCARMDRGTVGSASRGRLHVEIRHHGASAVVTVSGELDHHTADLLRESLEGCVDDGYARLVVDCSPLEFMDSTGLNVLLGARLKAEAEGAGCIWRGCSRWWPGSSRSRAPRRSSRCTTRSTRRWPTDVTAEPGTLHSGHVVRVTTSVPKKWVFSPPGRAGDI